MNPGRTVFSQLVDFLPTYDGQSSRPLPRRTNGTALRCIRVSGTNGADLLFRELSHGGECSKGIHITAIEQVERSGYLTFDVDANGSGQQASQQLAQRLRVQGTPLPVVCSTTRTGLCALWEVCW
jgi:hypothetical protein